MGCDKDSVPSASLLQSMSTANKHQQFNVKVSAMMLRSESKHQQPYSNAEDFAIVDDTSLSIRVQMALKSCM